MANTHQTSTRKNLPNATVSKKKIITKEIDDLEIDGNDISLTLAQEETFLFEEGRNVSIQLKIKTTEGLVFNSDIIEMRVDPSLDNEVI